MSIFEHRKSPPSPQPRDHLTTLRNTLKKLEAEPEATPRIAELKRILADRIAKLEGEDPSI